MDVNSFGLYGSQRLLLVALTQVAFGAMCVMGPRDRGRSMTGEMVAA